MGMYSDFYIHTGGCKAQDILDFVTKQQGWELYGEGGNYHQGDYTVEVRGAKWYEIIGDITAFLMEQDHEIKVWVLRLCENGLISLPTRRMLFHHLKRDGAWVVDYFVEPIDPVQFICGSLS